MQTYLDSQILKKRLRENIERYVSENKHFFDANITNIEKLNQLHDIADVHFFSHRKIIGKFIILTKKVIRKLLRPILNKQTLFNQSLIEELKFLNENIRNKQIEQAESLVHVIDEFLDEIEKQQITNRKNDFDFQVSWSNFQTSIESDIDNRLENAITNKIEFLGRNIEKTVNEKMNALENTTNQSIYVLEAATNDKIETINNKFNNINLKIEEIINNRLGGLKNEIVDEIKKIKIDIENQVTKKILVEIGDFYAFKSQYELSYQLYLTALKFDQTNLELERKVLESFDILNKSRNLK